MQFNSHYEPRLQRFRNGVLQKYGGRRRKVHRKVLRNERKVLRKERNLFPKPQVQKFRNGGLRDFRITTERTSEQVEGTSERAEGTSKPWVLKKLGNRHVFSLKISRRLQAKRKCEFLKYGNHSTGSPTSIIPSPIWPKYFK